jgi:hypothetical protein
MSDPDMPSASFPPARSDEERAAFFADLMREERQKNRSGMANDGAFPLSSRAWRLSWSGRVVINIVLTR